MWATPRAGAHLLSLAAACGQRLAGGQAQLRNASRLAREEAVTAKRERRKQRRQQNRELRERVAANSFGCHRWAHDIATKGSPHGHSSSSSSWTTRRCAPQDDCAKDADVPLHSEFDLFRAVLGKPRNRSEQAKFNRAWKQWQAAGVERSCSTTTTNGSTSGGSGSPNGGAGSGSKAGSAGASAGPRWGQADWSWEDFQQNSSSSSSSSRDTGRFSRWEYEAWYEPEPPNRGGAAGSNGSRRRSASSGWGWHRTWEYASSSGAWAHGADSRQHGGRSWQHQRDGSASSGGSSASLRGHLQLLGLHESWLVSRCGKLLRRAYLARAKRDHPDMHVGSGNVAAAEQRFKEVQAAFQALLTLVVS